jgi:hypothetical protein
MLNKAICKECRYRGGSDFEFDFMWEQEGLVDCLMLFVGKARYWEMSSIFNDSPERCPYVLEHKVCQESVSQC